MSSGTPRHRSRPWINAIFLVVGFAFVFLVVWLVTGSKEPGGPKSSLFRKSDLRYGMQVDPGTDLPRSLELLKEAGFGWAKVQLRWERLEKEKGQIDWKVIDDIVNVTNQSQVRLLFSVVAAPKWARPENTDLLVPGPPADPQDLADFLAAVASRHKGRVQAYEIWNEQNLAREWGGVGKPSAQEYVRLLEMCYRAIKAADPEALVISGGLTPAGDVDLGQGVLARDDRNFFREMYQAGLKGKFDAVGVHPSGYNNPPDDDPAHNSTGAEKFKGHWSFYYRNFENYRSIMEEFGDGDKKLWFTEFGWASGPNAPEYEYGKEISEKQQAQYLVRAFEIARERGYVGAMFLWNLNYAPSADAKDEQGKRVFSILNPDWSPRPAYMALKAMSK